MAHTIMEAEKLSAICKLEAQESQWFASGPNPNAWEPEKPSSESKGPRSRKASDQGQRRWMSQHKQESKFTLPPAFCKTLPSVNWMVLTMTFFCCCSFEQSLQIQMLTASRNTLTDNPQNNKIMCDLWASLISVKLSNKINHHTCNQRCKLNF